MNKGVLSSVFAVVGCIIGAGFISGTEIYLFFARYGIWGMVLCFVSQIVFVICALMLTNNHSKMYNLPKKINIFAICQLFISGTMFAGIANIISSLGVPIIMINVIVCAILAVFLIFGIKISTKINVYVGIICVLLLPILIILSKTPLKTAKIDINAPNMVLTFIFAVLYAFMNIVCGLPVINYVTANKTKRQKTLIIVIAAGAVLILQILVLLVISSFNISYMPLALVFSGPSKLCYYFILVLAMVSTITSASVGAKNIFGENFYSGFNTIWSVVVSLAIMLTSFIGFTNIIEITYPIVGILFVVDFVATKLQSRQKNTKTNRVNIRGGV